jgi:hypothetical protein
MEVSVNLLSVLLAGVASMAVGFLWYSPTLFGNAWMKEMGLTLKKLNSDKMKKAMGKTYGLSFLSSLVTAYVLSHVTSMSIAVFNYPLPTPAFTSAFFMWLGFVAPVQLTSVLYDNKSWKLFAINAGYQLAALMAMAAVIGFWSYFASPMY